MGWMDKMRDAIEWVADGIKRIIQFLGSEKSQETILRAIQLIILIASLIEKVRSRPMPGPEKLQYVRNTVNLLRYSTTEEIEAYCNLMLELKHSGELDDLNAAELDMILGPAVGLFIAQQKQDAAEDDGMDANTRIIKDQY